MWKQKLCIALGEQFGNDYEAQLELIKKVGFDGFFVEWNDKTDIEKIKNKAEKLGLVFQSLHAPYYKAADMWTKGEKANLAVNELLDCLHACEKAGVSIMVCHAFIGFEDHSPNENGVDNFGIIVKEAEKCGVKIAFENTEGEEYLAYLMDAFKGNENVGFCWDTGHEMCYNHSKDMMSLYGERIFCTHLNDNLGIKAFDGKITWIDDLHLLPFDGIADWNGIAKRLNKYNFNEILTFELNLKSKPDRHENDIYSNMSIEQYFTQAYIRACRFSAIKQNLK